MKKIIIIFVLIVLALFCLYKLFVVEIPDNGLSRTIAKLKKKYDLQITAVGERENKKDPGKLEELSVYIRRYGQSLNRSEARAMIIEVTQEILADMNNNEKVSSTLSPYPFTPKNLDVVIFNFVSENNRVIEPNIFIVSEFFGVVEYETIPSSKKYENEKKSKEPYEEAIAILERERKEAEKKTLEGDQNRNDKPTQIQ